MRTISTFATACAVALLRAAPASAFSPALLTSPLRRTTALAAKPAEARVKLTVKGDVGGYFRATARNTMRFNLGCKGVYTELSENEVLIEAEGRRRNLDTLVRWCGNPDLGLSQFVEIVGEPEYLEPVGFETLEFKLWACSVEGYDACAAVDAAVPGTKESAERVLETPPGAAPVASDPSSGIGGSSGGGGATAGAQKKDGFRAKLGRIFGSGSE